MTFPSFTKNPRCIKCGYTMADTRYHPGKITTISIRFASFCNGYDDEHFCRYCNQCGYTWREAVINDSSEMQSESPDLLENDTKSRLEALESQNSELKRINKILTDKVINTWDDLHQTTRQITSIYRNNEDHDCC